MTTFIMCVKLNISVIGFILVGLFATLGINDAINIKRHLQAQIQQISTLSVETKKINTKLNKITQTKEQSQQEISKLEQQTKDATIERAKLEAELGNN